MQLTSAANIWCILQLMMTLLYVETYLWTSACVARLTSAASCSWWWLCYMLKHACGQVLVLPGWRLVRPAADDDSVICWNVLVDKCLCRQAGVWCVLQLMMTLLNYFTLCKIVLWKIIFYCYHNFMKKSHSKLSKNDPQKLIFDRKRQLSW